MRFKTLDQWLRWQETLHPVAIDMGLERIKVVQLALQLHNPKYKVITVAGTNGKGSCAAMLNGVFSAAGYRVGMYISPHIKRYNERISINGEFASDAQLCESFQRIDQARGEVSLTYFEFGTLAAIDIFSSSNVEIAIMEVGLGGRLDAVNILDADAALISSIGLDHQDWLGDTREQIASEKVAVARAGRPLICGDDDPPSSLLSYAESISASLYVLNRDFGYRMEMDRQWQWWGLDATRSGLPLPGLHGEVQLKNASSVIMLLHSLQQQLPVSQANIRQGLLNGTLPGRFQYLTGPGPTVIVDVAHNPQAASALADMLLNSGCKGKTHAVFGVLRDKDIAGILQAMRHRVDHWYLADLHVERGSRSVDMAQIAKAIGINAPIQCYSSVKLAKESAILKAAKNDQIVVFGSFYTVSEVL